jgi:hypothetical protein
MTNLLNKQRGGTSVIARQRRRGAYGAATSIGGTALPTWVRCGIMTAT